MRKAESARQEAADGRASVRRRSQRIAEKRGLLFNPYTTRDVVAVAALLTARFGAAAARDSPGDVPRRLQKKLGKAAGRAVFDDLRAADDREAPTIGPGRFEYQLPPATAPGSVVIDDGSFQPTPISGGPVLRESTCGVERAARRREAIEDGAPDPPAGRRWATSSRSSSWRSTSTGAGTTLGRAASRTAVRRHRPRPRLRLDRDVVAGRQHRHLRREPVRNDLSGAAAGR